MSGCISSNEQIYNLTPLGDRENEKEPLMIEGLKVTVAGTELRDLCLQRSAHHKQRAAVYAEQVASMDKNKIAGMNYSGGDPRSNLQDKMAQHESEGAEMKFIAEHLVLSESYLLDADALQKLGITKRRY